MWFQDPDADAEGTLAIPTGVAAVLVVCVIGVLVAGIFPGTLLDLASGGASALGSASFGAAGAAAP
jgi:hypothetical protein